MAKLKDPIQGYLRDAGRALGHGDCHGARMAYRMAVRFFRDMYGMPHYGSAARRGRYQSAIFRFTSKLHRACGL